MSKFLGKNNLINLYICLAVVSLIAFITASIVTDGAVYIAATGDPTGRGIFGDHFMHVIGSSYLGEMYEIYGWACCFPPLAYIFFYLIYRIDPVQCKDILDWITMRDSNSTMLIFISYIVFEFLILGWIIQKLYKQYGFKIGVLMTLLIVVSYPFMFSATRHGNNVALAAILCLTAVVLGESDSKVEQEIGLILIAVAAGLKFYPAILGLIYVKKRDWKKVIRLVIYGIVIVIGPFAFFGGIKGITALVGYLTGLSERVAEINTYEGFFTWGLSKVGIPESVGGMAANLMLVVMIVCFFLAKKRWQEMLFLGSVMTSYISSSKDYNCVYYLVAFILFLEEEELLSEAKLAHNGWVLFNLLIFTMLFTVPFYLSAVFYNMVTGVYLILFAHLFVNVAQVLISGFSKKKTITEEAN